MSGNTRHWRSEQGEGEIVVFIVLALLVLLATSAWKELKNSSLMFRGMSLTDASSIYSVNADGTAYISCGGAPVVTSSGGLFSQVETYEVRFLNSEGLETRLSGVHKVETSQMPAEWTPQCPLIRRLLTAPIPLIRRVLTAPIKTERLTKRERFTNGTKAGRRGFGKSAGKQ